MKEMTIVENDEIKELYYDIKNLIDQSRNRVYKTINNEIIDLHWNIGKMIVEKQDGNSRAKYGDLLIEEISKRLTEQFAKVFSIQNLRRMRQFYMCFPIRSTISSELSISHYYELIRIKEENKRNFYMQECINSNWMLKSCKGKEQLYCMKE